MIVIYFQLTKEDSSFWTKPHVDSLLAMWMQLSQLINWQCVKMCLRAEVVDFLLEMWMQLFPTFRPTSTIPMLFFNLTLC